MTSLPGQGVMDGELVVGFVSGIFGTTGDVRVHLFNRESTMFRKRRSIALIDPKGVRYATFLKCRSGAGGRVLGRLEGPTTREDVAALRDWKIAIPRIELPSLEEGEFYLFELVGRAVAIGDEGVGTVAQVHQNGPVDILEVALPGGESAYIPALSEYIADVRAVPLQLHEAARGLFE